MKTETEVLERLKDLERFRHHLLNTAASKAVYESVGYNRVVGGIELLMWWLNMDEQLNGWLKVEGEMHGR